MKKTRIIRILFILVFMRVLFMGISLIKETSALEKNGYEKVPFKVVDYEVTDVSRKISDSGPSSGKTKYDMDYKVTYEYEWEGATYTYNTSTSTVVYSRTSEPCSIGDIKYYYINPNNPGDTSTFVQGNNRLAGIIVIAISVLVIGIIVACGIIENKSSTGGARTASYGANPYISNGSHNGPQVGYGNVQDLYNNSQGNMK